MQPMCCALHDWAQPSEIKLSDLPWLDERRGRDRRRVSRLERAGASTDHHHLRSTLMFGLGQDGVEPLTVPTARSRAIYTADLIRARILSSALLANTCLRRATGIQSNDFEFVHGPL